MPFPHSVPLVRRRLSGLNLLRCSIPNRRAVPEIRLIRQMARQRRVVPKHGIFRDRPTIPDCLKEAPQVRFQVIPGIALIGKSL